nr:MAG TPA: hypothetical protein [Caudoviricetes sp.]
MATKKQIRAERTLEKTVLKAESAARAIKAQELQEEGLDPYSCSSANTDTFSVVCPDCGQLVPSEYDSFLSQKDADDYAREHCDCHSGKVIPIRRDSSDAALLPHEKMMEIIFSPAPDNRPELKPVIPLNYAVCRYCGQAQNVSGCGTPEQAEEYVTLHCNCKEAKIYQNRVEAAQEREYALERVSSNLNSIFPDVKPEPMELMFHAAEAIYDRKLVSFSLKLSYMVSGKISRNAKGNIVVERKDSAAQKVEV